MSKRYQFLAERRRSHRYFEAISPCKKAGIYHGYINCKTCLRPTGSTVISQELFKLQGEWDHLRNSMVYSWVRSSRG